MASYVYLTLDTTAPIITIILPPYSTPTGVTHIAVQSNEPLSRSYQNFYIIDSDGVRTDIVMFLSPDDMEYSVSIALPNVDIGTATFYAQVKDTVDNLSPLLSQPFTMFKSEFLLIAVYDEEFAPIVLKEEVANTVYSQDQRTMKVDIEDGIYPR